MGGPAVVQLQTADIFKLDIDCIEEAFDYLSFYNLISVGLTCKRLYQVVGYIIKQNYSAKRMVDHPKWQDKYYDIQMIRFGRFLKRMVYHEKMLNNLPEINQLRRFQILRQDELEELKLESHKEKFKKVERLDVYGAESKHPKCGRHFPDAQRK